MPAAEPQPLSRLIEEQETRTVASRIGFIQLIKGLNNNGNWTIEEESEIRYCFSDSADSYSSESGTDSGYGSMSVDSS